MPHRKLVYIGFCTGICLRNCIEASTVTSSISAETTEAIPTTSKPRPTTTLSTTVTVQHTTTEELTTTPIFIPDKKCGEGCTAGIVVGILLAAVIIIMLILWVCRKRGLFCFGNDCNRKPTCMTQQPLPSGRDLSLSLKHRIRRDNPDAVPDAVPECSQEHSFEQKTQSVECDQYQKGPRPSTAPKPNPLYMNGESIRNYAPTPTSSHDEEQISEAEYVNGNQGQELYSNQDIINEFQRSSKEAKTTPDLFFDPPPPSGCTQPAAKQHDYINGRVQPFEQESYMCMAGNSRQGKPTGSDRSVVTRNIPNRAAESEYKNVTEFQNEW